MSNKPKSSVYRARQIHRYLGLFIGVQFVLWTVGGLYFSWTDLDEVHGDHLQRRLPVVSAGAQFASPAALIEAIREEEPVDSLAGLGLVNLLGAPTYRIDYFTREEGAPVRKTRLGDAGTGRLRTDVTREEAVRMAQFAFAESAPIRSVEYFIRDSIGRHHEYREQPLPAWAITFEHRTGATAYVAAELGEVQRIRHETWRVFDFLWMLHTMDYAGRDNFNNLVLRIFSVLGLATVLSGFVLFGFTSRRVRRWLGLNRRERGPDRRRRGQSAATAR